MRGTEGAVLSFKICQIKIFDRAVIDSSTVGHRTLNDIINLKADGIIIKYLIFFVSNSTSYLILLLILGVTIALSESMIVGGLLTYKVVC